MTIEAQAPVPPPRKATLWKLIRADDESGVSGTGHVADAVVWHDGKVTVHWRTETTSTTVYDSVTDVVKIHGHNGKTQLVPAESPFENGRRCAGMDQMENAPFACAGGLESRASMTTPSWVAEDDRAEWLAGYEFAARRMYGDDWRTCSFGWSAAVTVERFTTAPEADA